jgi:uncharacterized protein YgfB (UPF0149 family)
MTARILALLAGVAVAFSAGWLVNGWRLGEQIAHIETEQAQAELSAALAAGIKEAEWTKNLEDARNAATKREQTLRRAAAGARDVSDGLRADLAELRRQLPDLAAEAVRQRADTLAELFNQCQEDYRSVAEKADRHASDVQTLEQGWPR